MTLEPWIEHDKRRGTYQIRWRNERGEVQRDKGYVWKTATDAKTRANQIARRLKDGALGIASPILLKDAFIIFRKHIGPKLASERQQHNCELYTQQICDSFLGEKFLHQITYTHIVDYWESFLSKERGCKVSTANRSIMWIQNLYNRFKMWNAMVPEMMPEKVLLPDTNPVEVANEYLGRKRSELPLKRKRRLSREELQKMKEWCLDHYPDFWQDLKLAMLTSLRKSDLLRLKQGNQVSGIQGKTQRPFDLPLMVDRAVTSQGMRWRWDQLRKDLGWYEKGTPLHTTWHDLRHCGPSMLADLGYSSKIIQEILGHATEQQSKTYTHISAHALAPAMAALQKELSSI